MIYHADYIAGALSFVGMYLVGKKKWYGWVINLITNAVYIALNVHFALWGLLPGNVVMVFLFIHNAWKWQRKGVA